MEFDFWRAPNGKIPVKEFIRYELDKENSAKLWQRLDFFKELSVSSMWKEQHLGHYDKELDYLRIILKRVYCRIFCIMKEQKCILFHAFVKKKNKIPIKEARIARERVRVYRAEQISKSS